MTVDKRIVWEDRGPRSQVAYIAGRYSGWVEPAPIPGWWLGNWSLAGDELETNWPRLWANPLGEEPGHLWPTVDEAKSAVEDEIGARFG